MTFCLKHCFNMTGQLSAYLAAFSLTQSFLSTTLVAMVFWIDI